MPKPKRPRGPVFDELHREQAIMLIRDGLHQGRPLSALKQAVNAFAQQVSGDPERTLSERTFGTYFKAARAKIRETWAQAPEDTASDHVDKLTRLFHHEMQKKNSHAAVRISDQISRLLGLYTIPFARMHKERLEAEAETFKGVPKEYRRARKDLLAFIELTHRTYQASWFHKDLCERLMDFYAAVKRGEGPRLMVMVPPRHGKTEAVTRRFPAWAFGVDPDLSIIAASYSAALSNQNNRDVQRIIDSEVYGEVFPNTSLFGRNSRSRAEGSYLRNAEQFEIVGHKGSFLSVGRGGGVTGKGCSILLIDDPFKDAEEAGSPSVREKVWEWYTSTAYTRLEPGGGVLLVMTRWHQDDLAGRLLKAAGEGGDQWEVIRYPAIAEQKEERRDVGDPLWPERWPRERLDKIKNVLTATQGYRAWEALYQQNPVPRAGAMFTPEWFEIVETPPAGAQARVRYWDRAATKSRKGVRPDWTVGVRMSRLPDGRFIVENVVRLQGTPGEVERAIRNTAKQDGRGVHIGLEQEPGASGKYEADALIKALAGYVVTPFPADRSKEERAAPLSSQAEAGNVLLARAPWNDAFLEELRAFPHGTHDDQVDAASGALSMLVRSLPDFAPFALGETAEEYDRVRF